jgi:hypothetical protein
VTCDLLHVELQLPHPAACPLGWQQLDLCPTKKICTQILYNLMFKP